MDEQTEQRRGAIWWPLLSALAVVGGAAYAFSYGVAAIPPFFALLLVGALANVLFRGTEALRSRLNNVATAGMSAIALMLSMLANVALIAWVIWFVLTGTTPNLVEQFAAAKDVDERVFIGTQLLIPALLALLGLVQLFNLWRLVRANAFGTRAS